MPQGPMPGQDQFDDAAMKATDIGMQMGAGVRKNLFKPRFFE